MDNICYARNEYGERCDREQSHDGPHERYAYPRQANIESADPYKSWETVDLCEECHIVATVAREHPDSEQPEVEVVGGCIVCGTRFRGVAEMEIHP